MKTQSASRSEQNDQKIARPQERFFAASTNLEKLEAFFDVDKDTNKLRRKRGREIPESLTSTK